MFPEGRKPRYITDREGRQYTPHRDGSYQTDQGVILNAVVLHSILTGGNRHAGYSASGETVAAGTIPADPHDRPAPTPHAPVDMNHHHTPVPGGYDSGSAGGYDGGSSDSGSSGF